MVKTLQRKFIAASMLAVTLLLLTLVGAINLLNAVSVTQRQGRILEMLCETDADPERQRGGQDGQGFRGEKGQQFREQSQDPGSSDGGKGPGERGGIRRGTGGPRPMIALPGSGRDLSVDNVLSARFFAVWFDGEGVITDTDVSRIYAVDEESAARYAQEILAQGRESGSWQGFRYLLRARTQTGDGSLEDSSSAGTTAGEGSGSAEAGTEKILVAMDVSADRDGMLSVLGISSLIALICWLVMLVPVRMLAGRAIAPTALSIERQKQFVTNAGHELKTPLAIIQANTEALELYHGESRWTRNILAQTVRLNGLMQNLLTLSKMDESGLQLELAPFRLDLLARESWEDFSSSAEARALTVRFDLSRADALGNRESVAQLLSILYDNAVKYTPRGGEICIHVRETPQGAELVQSNTVEPAGHNGAGAAEDPERLFERFYRTDGDRSRKKGGYGIGLSAARAIAAANRGSIHAEAEEGRLVFIFRLRTAPS